MHIQVHQGLLLCRTLSPLVNINSKTLLFSTGGGRYLPHDAGELGVQTANNQCMCAKVPKVTEINPACVTGAGSNPQRYPGIIWAAVVSTATPLDKPLLLHHCC